MSLLITARHLWVACAVSLFLILFHYLSPKIANFLPGNGRVFISFAGGVAVAYVFLRMRPNLVEYK